VVTRNRKALLFGLGPDVDYSKWYPGPNCGFPWVFVQPYLIVRTDTYPGEVVFDSHWEEDPCDW